MSVLQQSVGAPKEKEKKEKKERKEKKEKKDLVNTVIPNFWVNFGSDYISHSDRLMIGRLKYLKI